MSRELGQAPGGNVPGALDEWEWWEASLRVHVGALDHRGALAAVSAALERAGRQWTPNHATGR